MLHGELEEVYTKTMPRNRAKSSKIEKEPSDRFEQRPRRPNPRREIEDELDLELECLEELDEYDDLDA